MYPYIACILLVFLGKLTKMQVFFYSIYISASILYNCSTLKSFSNFAPLYKVQHHAEVM